MDLTFAGPVTMSTRSYDDTIVEIEIAPTPEHPMMLDEMAVQFYGNDDQWAECLHDFTEIGELSWCVPHLRLSARPTVKAPKVD